MYACLFIVHKCHRICYHLWPINCYRYLMLSGKCNTYKILCKFYMILGLRSKELQEGGDYFTAKYFSLFTCHAACDGIVLEFRIHLVDSPSVSLCGKVGVLFYRG